MDAQNEARKHGQPTIRAVHLLRAIFEQEESSVARVALVRLGMTPKIVEGYYPLPGLDATVGQIPFSKNAKDSLELALREALSLGHNYIGTEHILLGLVRLGKGSACEVFEGEGITARAVRDEVIEALMAVVHTQPADSLDRAFEVFKKMSASGFKVLLTMNHVPVVQIERRSERAMAWSVRDIQDFDQVAQEHGAEFAISTATGPTFIFR